MRRVNYTRQAVVMEYYDIMETKYILLSDKLETLFLDKPNWNDNWQQRYFPGCKHADAFRLTGRFDFANTGNVFYPVSPIYINWELLSSHGASYLVFAEQGTVYAKIAAVKRYIHNHWDAVSIRVIRYTVKQYAISTEQFDKILLDILSEMKATQLIDIPGIYEIVAEEFNNEILERLEKD